MDSRLCQGDILRDVSVLEDVKQSEDADNPALDVVTRDLPYVVTLTQDCDLEQDYASRANPQRPDFDKFLIMVLLCPAYPAAQFREGKHLDDDHPMQRFNSARWTSLQRNQIYRYHFLPASVDLQIPELALDFKQYFTMRRDTICGLDRNGHYLASICELFREDLCRRFAQYLTRIALPELSADSPSTSPDTVPSP
ncbi:MAG: hypothetical protein ACREQE_08995 [Candidatus Binataceae bacterium]